MSNNLRLFSIYFKIPVAQQYARKASIYSERYLNFPLAFEFLKVFPELWMENLRKSSNFIVGDLRYDHVLNTSSASKQQQRQHKQFIEIKSSS